MATESTEGHGKISNGYYFFPCFSVDSVAIISAVIRLKQHLRRYLIVIPDAVARQQDCRKQGNEENAVAAETSACTCCGAKNPLEVMQPYLPPCVNKSLPASYLLHKESQPVVVTSNLHKKFMI